MTNSTSFHFDLVNSDRSGTRARLGKVTTAHGSFDTPVFMPIATRASVKTMTPVQLKEVGSTIILSNTYHLALRPGEQLVQKMGGLHKFMAWDGPILTDSGGFQVFSLAGLRKINDKGVTFRSHINGDLFTFTPESVMAIQEALGTDIVMPLDHCVGSPCSHEDAKAAAERSVAWAKRSQAAKQPNQQALFGIVQGGVYSDLRRYCAEELVALDLSGYALGGLAVGESKEEMEQVITAVDELLPTQKPRYLMGVGTPEDILMAVAHGVDMFDCVMPTRNARGGGAFTSAGKIQIRNSAYRDSPIPIDPECTCYCCRTFTRAYLHHLFSKKVEEIVGLIMLTLHNLTFYHRLMTQIRQAIREDRYAQFMAGFLHKFHRHEEE